MWHLQVFNAADTSSAAIVLPNQVQMAAISLIYCHIAFAHPVMRIGSRAGGYFRHRLQLQLRPTDYNMR